MKRKSRLIVIAQRAGADENPAWNYQLKFPSEQLTEGLVKNGLVGVVGSSAVSGKRVSVELLYLYSASDSQRVTLVGQKGWYHGNLNSRPLGDKGRFFILPVIIRLKYILQLRR